MILLQDGVLLLLALVAVLVVVSSICVLLLQGGVVIVSHDERLIRLICREVWVCGDLKVHRVEGGIDEYKKLVQQELAAS